MFEPELYHKVHKKLKSVAGNIIKEYFSKIEWRPDGCDTLMDVGSGPGDVLMEHIYPRMPENFHKIVCSDISKDMLEFARKYYGNPNKIEYRVLDITTMKGMPSDLRATVDHLTSIYCLHMVPDIGMAITNIYDLLRSDGGDCFMVFMSKTTILDAYDYMRNSAKWLEYKQDIERYIPPIYYSKNAMYEFQYLLKKTGFTDITVEARSEICGYESFEDFKDDVQSVCPVLQFISPPTLQSEFLNELVEVIMNFSSKSENTQQMDSKYCIRFDLLVASAKKI